MMYLADGNIPGPSWADTFFRVKPLNYAQSFDYTSFFAMRIYINKNIIFNVGVERIPIMDRNERVTRYEFKPYMNFIDIINDNKMVTEVNEVLAHQFAKLNDDVARGPAVVDDLVPVLPKGYQKEDYLFKIEEVGMMGESIVVRNDIYSQSVKRYRPPHFDPVYLSNAESSSLIFDP